MSELDETFLIETCKVNSHKEAIQGEIETHIPGVYIIQFDNTQSR